MFEFFLIHFSVTPKAMLNIYRNKLSFYVICICLSSYVYLNIRAVYYLKSFVNDYLPVEIKLYLEYCNEVTWHKSVIEE